MQRGPRGCRVDADMKTISGIEVDAGLYAVLAELASLHGISLQEYCKETLQSHVDDVFANEFYSADIGALVVKRWKKQWGWSR